MMDKLKQIVEAALLAAGGPLTVDNLQELFLEEERPEKKDLREVLAALAEDYQGRGIQIAEVAGGFRVNVREEYAPWVSRLWEERAPRYSRALLETLALIAYRQPITRGEIEEIRGVSVSSNIVKTLLEREWVRVVGTRDVPGKPSLYATTREFLNYFGLKSLDELPTLQQIRDLDSINQELELAEPGSEAAENSPMADGEEPDNLDQAQVDSKPDDGITAAADRLAEVISLHTEDTSAEMSQHEADISAAPEPDDASESAAPDGKKYEE